MAKTVLDLNSVYSGWLPLIYKLKYAKLIYMIKNQASQNQDPPAQSNEFSKNCSSFSKRYTYFF